MSKNKVITHFKAVDPILYQAISGNDWYEKNSRYTHFAGLCRIIVGQQLSVKAAHSIFTRFAALFPNKKPRPELALELSLSDLRDVGLSAAKCASVRDLAQKITDGSLRLRQLASMEDHEVIAALTEVRGIGPWSAEMFLISYLGRDDVFSGRDLGLRMAIKKLYDLSELPSHVEADEIARRWAPYRSYACRILWRSLDNEPT